MILIYSHPQSQTHPLKLAHYHCILEERRNEEVRPSEIVPGVGGGKLRGLGGGGGGEGGGQSLA